MSNQLIEYRCSCNKLLLKGSLLFSTVELKCNRCGSINTFQSKGKNNESASFSFFIDSLENVTGSCGAVCLLDVPKKQFMGKHVQNLISYLNNKNNVDFFVLPEYGFENNNSSNWDEILKNVNEIKKDKPSGYHLFGIIDNIKPIREV